MHSPGARDRTAHRPGQAFAKAGENPLVACECLLASRAPASGPEGPPFTGFIPDTVLRKLGYSLVDGSILGMALLMGSPAFADEAAGMARELQEKYMLTFLPGEIIRILSSAGVKTGLDYRLVPLGSRPLHGVHFIDIVARVAMMFGGVVPGDAARLIAYAAERAKVFAIVFPGLSDEEIAFTDTLRALSIPVLTTGGYEGGTWEQVTAGEAVRRGMEMKDIRVKVTAIPIPMGCSPAFEGKSIRKEEMYVEFGGGRSPAFELLRIGQPGQVVDGRVTVIGPENRRDAPGLGDPPRDPRRSRGKEDAQGVRARARAPGSTTSSTTARAPGTLPSGTSSGSGSRRRRWRRG